jgi:hypothetical protein
MTPSTFALVAAVASLLQPLSVGSPAPPFDASAFVAGEKSRNATPLAEAIEKFNKHAKSDPVGEHQPPLTKDEVVAAIRLAQRASFPESPDSLFRAYKRVADTGELPPNADFDDLSSLDCGGDFVFDVWYVRIGLPKADGGTYYFSIRSQVVGSRTVAEEAVRLEKALREVPARPGRTRLEDRLRELKARAGTAPRGVQAVPVHLRWPRRIISSAAEG